MASGCNGRTVVDSSITTKTSTSAKRSVLTNSLDMTSFYCYLLSISSCFCVLCNDSLARVEAASREWIGGTCKASPANRLVWLLLWLARSRDPMVSSLSPHMYSLHFLPRKQQLSHWGFNLYGHEAREPGGSYSWARLWELASCSVPWQLVDLQLFYLLFLNTLICNMEMKYLLHRANLCLKRCV